MPPVGGEADYRALVPDPQRLIDLPRGFSYRVISSLADWMDDGWRVPDRADGMGRSGSTTGAWRSTSAKTLVVALAVNRSFDRAGTKRERCPSGGALFASIL